MTISIAHIILYGSESVVVDLSGISTDLVLDRNGGDLGLVVTENVTMRGNAGGVLSLSGNGQIDLTGIVFCRNLNRDEFTGTLALHDFWFEYTGAVFWVFSKTSNLFDVLHVLAGGIR